MSRDEPHFANRDYGKIHDNERDAEMKENLLTVYAQQIAGFIYGTTAVLTEMREGGATPDQICRMIWQHLRPDHQKKLGSADQFVANLTPSLSAVIDVMSDGRSARDALEERGVMDQYRALEHGERIEQDEHELPARIIICRLLADAAKERPGQQPTIECGVLLTGGIGYEGALRERDDGTLELLGRPQPDPANPTRMVAVEHFFGYHDVVAIMKRRDIVAEKPSGIIFRQ